MSEESPHWHFRRLPKAEMGHDPTEEEFFREESLPDAITREGIQNTLDAARDEATPAIFQVSLHTGDSALPADAASQYLEGIPLHIKASNRWLPNLPDLEGPLPFIAVEDFNTRGLEGDPEQFADREAPNDFYYFYRNRGRSGKSATDRGRWGLGKLVFPASSRINSMIGLTVRNDDSRTLLMGRSILRTHQMNGEERYSPFGYFSRIGEEGFAVPVEGSSEFVDNFKADFSLERGERPGLSVVVPFPFQEDEEEAPLAQQFAKSAIRYYFHPILSGQLEVRVSDASGEDLEITESTIEDVSQGLDWSGEGISNSELLQLFSFSKWSLECTEEDRAELLTAGDGGAPNFDEDLFPEGTLESLREQFQSGERVAIRVPVMVKPEDDESVESYFDAFIQREDSSEYSIENYIRQGLTISGIQFVKSNGFRGLLDVNDAPLSSLLGDSENPAHTMWHPMSKKVRKDYEHGYSTVNFVRRALDDLDRLLSPQPEGFDEDVLVDFFNIEVPEADGDVSDDGEVDDTDVDDPTDETDGPGDGGENEPPDPDVPPTPRPKLATSQTEDGFKVKVREDGPVPARVTIRVAYAVRHGDPFKNYSLFDFKVSEDPIVVEASGGTVSELQQNVIKAEVDSSEFVLHARGFDRRRDLTIDTTAHKGNDQE